ncbi:MAG TPA: RDD family protein [Gaiellaceae bacterium]|nr:RDD family protein [Gaiellaceae bacterium]
MSTGVASGARASFGRRLVAYLLDGVVLGVIAILLEAILGRLPGGGLGILVGLVYVTYFQGSPSGQTPGMRVFGIRVYDFTGASTNGIGYGRAFIRWIGYYISGLVCGLGFFWMLWDKEKQCWHDKLASTVVVPIDQYPVDSWPG